MCLHRGVRTSIRRARAADSSLVASLLHDFNTEFGDPDPAAAAFESRFGTLLDREDIVVHLAEQGGVAVGFAMVTLRPTPYFLGPLAQLEELYVVPSRRSAGVGSALLESARSYCSAAGAEEMQINVDGPDLGARRFYERHGFSHLDDGEPMFCYVGSTRPAKGK